MILQSQYSKSFLSDHLTESKYSELRMQAMSLNVIRNELSLRVSADIMKYLKMSKIDFQKLMLPSIKDRIHSNFTKQLCDDVLIVYQNRFDAIKNKMRFERVKSIEFTFYKRDTRNKKKGDPKGLVRKTESTPLTKSLSFLARYGHEDITQYLESAVLSPDTEVSKRKFYAQTLNYIRRFDFKRMMNLALSKRKRILNKYKTPVEFKSLTFRGRSRLSTDIVSYNRNFNSVIKAFICFGWTERNATLKIPVLYSKKWHGAMNQYTNGTDTSYRVFFNELNKTVRVILSHEGDREIPDAGNADTYVGFDVNSKHNQLTDSKGITVDYDREVLDALILELLKTDKLKSIDPEYKEGKRREIKIETLRRKVKHQTERNCAGICKQMVLNKENHAVFEDLNNSFGKSFIFSGDINYNRLVKEMHLSSIKDEFEHIARKYKISVSTVHPEYTSIQCAKCGYIDEENRKNQEEFECLECGHKDNADHNAAVNLQRRVSEAVQRDCLLKASKLGNGSYSPKTLSRWKVKELLLSFRDRVYPVPPGTLREPVRLCA